MNKLLKKRKILMLIFILFLFNNLRSEVKTTDGDFLKIEAGGREAGMGGAISALVDDIESLDVNVAGLAKLNKTQLFLGHTEWLENIKYENFSIAGPFKLIDGTIGMNLKYLYIPPFESYDDWGYVIKKVKYNGVVFKTGYGTKILKNNIFLINVGLSMSIIRQQLDDLKYFNPSSDFGILIGVFHHIPKIRKVFGDTINISIVAQNIDFIKKELPLLIKAGLGFKIFNQLNIGIDFMKYVDTSLGVNMGLEYWYRNFISIRAGTKLGTSNINYFIPGIGIKYKILGYICNIDYSATPLSRNLGTTHRFSIKINMRREQKISNVSGQILYYKGIYHFTHNEYEEAISLWEKIPKDDPNYPKAQIRIKEAEKIIECEEEKIKKRLKELEENFKKLQKK